MASQLLKVEFKAEKALKNIEKRYGKANVSRKAQQALERAADRTVVPAVRSETPSGKGNSPWNRGTTKWSKDLRALRKYPGPMKDRVHVYKRVKKRGRDEAAVIVVSIRHYAVMAVVRGTYKTGAHREPQHPYYSTRDHPGFKGNDIFGRALKRSRGALVKAIAAEMKRI